MYTAQRTHIGIMLVRVSRDTQTCCVDTLQDTRDSDLELVTVSHTLESTTSIQLGTRDVRKLGFADNRTVESEANVRNHARQHGTGWLASCSSD